MWQTVERKAKFIAQVMRGRLDMREMEDIGDAALSYNEVKALATGNPLLLEKAEAEAELTRLERAERAFCRNQDALRHRVTQAGQRITALTALTGDIGTAIALRRDTRGDAFALTVGGFTYTKRADAGRHLQQITAQMEDTLLKSGHRRLLERPGELGGFPVTITVERVLGSVNVILALDRAPGTEIRMSPAEIKAADPAKLVIRLENRLSSLESLKTRTLAEIDQLTVEAAHGQDDLARSFTQAGQLDAARERVARLNKQLGQAAAPPHPADDGDDWLVKAAMHDAGVMARIPGSSVMVISHRGGEPESAVQASRYDFPSGNPLAGAASESGPASPRPSRPPGRSARRSP
jgi:phage shock protein A